MGKIYRIEPNTSTYHTEIEADSPEEALEKFADEMDSDMGAYFKAVEKPEPTELEKAIQIFRDNTKYDDNDEAMFRSRNPRFMKGMEELLSEKDFCVDQFQWESHVVERMTAILNFCQYGDTSDPDELEKIAKDIEARGLVRRYYV